MFGQTLVYDNIAVMATNSYLPISYIEYIFLLFQNKHLTAYIRFSESVRTPPNPASQSLPHT